MLTDRVVPAAIAIFCLALIGCGDSDLPPAYSVKGKVTVQGTPLSGYLVSFVPTDGNGGASAKTGSDGGYSLETLDGRPGCQLGKYKVVIRPGIDAIQEAMKNVKPSAKSMPNPESKVPDTYSAAGTSPKEVEVKAEKNVIDIAI